MSYPVNTTDNEYAISSGNQFDVKKFVYKILGLLPWFILSLAIAIFVARIYLRYTLPVYKISAFLLIKSQEEGGNSEYKTLKEMGLVMGNKDVQNEMNIIKSFSLMNRVVDSLHLNVNLYQEGRITAAPMFGEKSPISFDILDETQTARPAQHKIILHDNNFSITNLGRDETHAYGEPFETEFGKIVFNRNRKIKADPKGYTLTYTDKISTAKMFKNALDVRPTHDQSGIIEISMLDEMPERAMAIVNKLMNVYDIAGLDDKNIAGRRTIRFLNERIDTVKQELNVVEILEQQYKSNNRISSVTGEANMFLSQAMAVDNQKSEQFTQLKVLETLEQYMTSAKSTNDLIPSGLGISEASLMSLISAHNQMVMEKQRVALKSTDDDPMIKNYDLQINDIRSNMLRNIALLKNGYKTSLNQISNNYGSIEGKIAGLPVKERQLVNIKRQINLKENLYNYLLQKREETELSLASNINNTRIIDSAYNTGPVKPIASNIQLLAILIGLAVPTLIIVLRDFFNNKINDRKEIEEGTTVPILGELTYEKNKQGIVIDSKSRSPISEQFRLIRTNIQYMGADRPVKTILVSSFMSGEGKSFVSLNLASSMSITGAKTVILEFDLRKPKLSKYLNVPGEFGLSNYIIKDIPIQNLIQKVPNNDNIYVISSGPIPPNPAELLLSEKTSKLFEYLRENFDNIIIDTAPVGLVTDALLLEKFADMTVFIIRHKYSNKLVVPYVEKLHRDKKFKSLSIIVNGIKDDSSFGYGYGYGYGYVYGYGYYVQEKKKGFLGNLMDNFSKKN